MPSRIKRYIGEHAEDCCTRWEEFTGSPWCLPESVRASENGAIRVGYYTWVMWHCIEIHCEAQMMVRQDALLTAIAEMEPVDA